MAGDLTPDQAAALDLDQRLRSVEARLAKVEAWAEHQRRRMADEVLRLKMLLLDAQRNSSRRDRDKMRDTSTG